MRNSIRGKWHHLIWVMEKDHSTLYVDGDRIERIRKPGTNLGQHNGSIGYASDGSSFCYFSGEIDEVMIWARALTPNQVGLVCGLLAN